MKRNKLSEHIKGFFSKNISLKIFSALAAFAIWFVVMGTLNPAESQIYNVNLTIVGEEDLERNGLICSNLSDLKNRTVGVRIRASRTNLNSLNENKGDITATLDLSRFENYYDEDLSEVFYASVVPAISLYGSAYEIVGYSPSGFNVELDRMVEFDVPVSAVVEKEADEGYTRDEPKPSLSTVTVRGPEKLKDSVSYAELPLDLTGLSGEKVLHIRPILIDINGNRIEDGFEIMDASVGVTVNLRREGEIKILPPKTTGEPATGFNVGEIRVTPDTVKVTAESDSIGIEEIELDPINIEGADESFSRKINLASILSAKGLKLDSESDEATIEVTIEKDNAHTAVIDSSDITVVGLGEGLELKEKPSSITFEAYGSEALIKNSKLTGVIDLEGLGEGVHTVDVTLALPAGVVSSGKVRTEVEIVKKAEITESSSQPEEISPNETSAENTVTEIAAETPATEAPNGSEINPAAEEKINKEE